MEKNPQTPHSAPQSALNPASDRDQGGQRELTPAAQRALAEAEQRRSKGVYEPEMPSETGGRDGPEPIRYGDWEKNGIASDF